MGNYCSPEQVREKLDSDERDRLVADWQDEQRKFKNQIRDLKEQNDLLKQTASSSDEVATLTTTIQQMRQKLNGKEEDLLDLEKDVKQKESRLQTKAMELQNLRAANNQLNAQISRGEMEKSKMDGVEIHFQCVQLPNLDMTSLTDAFVVVYLRNSSTGKWEELTRTEVVFDSLDPKFMRSIVISPYDRESVTGNSTLRFWVYDNDSGIEDPYLTKLDKEEPVGYCDMEVDEIVSQYFAEDQILAGKQLIAKSGKEVVQSKGKPSLIKICSVEWFSMAQFSRQSTYVLELEFKLGHSKFKKKPYFEIFRKKNDDRTAGWMNGKEDDFKDENFSIDEEKAIETRFVKIYQSPVLLQKKDLLFNSEIFSLGSYNLTQNNDEYPLYIKLYEEKMKKGIPRCVSRAIVTMEELLSKKNATNIDMHLDITKDEVKKNEGEKKKKKPNLIQGSKLNLRQSWTEFQNKTLKGELPMSLAMSFMSSVKVNKGAQMYFEDDKNVPKGWKRVRDENGYSFFVDDKTHLKFTTADAAAAVAKKK